MQREREPSPERRSTKQILPDEIFPRNDEIPYANLFPPNVEILMKQMKAQKIYQKAAEAMNEIMEDMSLRQKHNDKRFEIRDRLRRKLAEKRKAAEQRK
jgi:hypothetical protein